ncbi:acyltransferase ChoActase/COT/CPT [Sistotremastrum niveocremeum HHB9708]|uniref:Acyltransferase ChoActase/COT/CPT n=1 Tax=Sistotremastrum niveocremeum HHB9708 TaxID=1314777 RepID=A0A164VLR4_9AGAM|nr:acyltransferase ChoActase/COT/CPT [Sistotremastrum niveocremeum HHB9708]
MVFNGPPVARRAFQSTSTPKRPFPRLPVPSLHHTLEQYLRSIDPFLDDTSLTGHKIKSDAVCERQAWLQDFETGVGARCQERLLELDKVSEFNWLDDNFWLRKAYHEPRIPLLIHSNWWLALRPDPQPQLAEGHGTQVVASGITEHQLKVTAWLIRGFLDLKVRLDRFLLNLRTEHWARRPALRMYNRCRVPREDMDVFASPSPASDPDRRKILVMVNSQCYAIQVLDSDGRPRSPRTIEQSLRKVVLDDARQHARRCLPVGIMSSDDRSSWAKNREHLAALSSQNTRFLNIIDQSLFAVSLDSACQVPEHSLADQSETAVDAHLHNIRSGPMGHNRWFDKSFTLITEPCGRTGMMGEHSPCDALVPSMMADYAISEPINHSAFSSELSSPSESTSADVEYMSWVTDSQLEDACQVAAARAQAIIEASDDSLLDFKTFGTAWISEAKLGADGFIQLAIQLAWYRQQGAFTAVYETALTRAFLNGRTETIRSFTTESRRFVEAMVDTHASPTIRYVLLKDALRVHTGLTRKAVVGRGIDRHLLALRLLMKEDESSPVFTDPVFWKSQEWLLSTSGLSAGERFVGTGFGAGFEDGYGINYMAGPDRLRFGIESKKPCPTTSTAGFKELLRTSLLDMQTLCLAQGRDAHL